MSDEGRHEPTAEPASGDRSEPAPEPGAAVDLDEIESDLAAVEAALARMDDGTYWTDPGPRPGDGTVTSGTSADPGPTSGRAQA
ncbi:hypothetical protein [Ilumatobacter sp.]|uniref:hypothetical protein n=1 Tax=Ilumatobacter sp. TaxID=1967498 RepID=UPI003B522C3D